MLRHHGAPVSQSRNAGTVLSSGVTHRGSPSGLPMGMFEAAALLPPLLDAHLMSLPPMNPGGAARPRLGRTPPARLHASRGDPQVPAPRARAQRAALQTGIPPPPRPEATSVSSVRCLVSLPWRGCSAHARAPRTARGETPPLPRGLPDALWREAGPSVDTQPVRTPTWVRFVKRGEELSPPVGVASACLGHRLRRLRPGACPP